MNKIHSQAVIEGNVVLGENVTVCACAVLRGDEGQIKVGNNSSIQETCVVHGKNVVIGENVTVGHGAILHGCKIADNVLIGINSTILDGAEIGEWCIVAAGSVVTPNTKVPAHSVVMGVPAKIVRKTTEKDLELITRSWKHYAEK
jgi:carbonic anhydrase/acetyltransferase-like protein (isoleucine patch superfamily)